MQSKPQGSKISHYETLKQVEKSTGKTPPYIQLAPKLPEDCESLWSVFCKLGDISYAELDSYSRLTGETLGQWEIEAIMGLNILRRSKQEWHPDDR